MLCNIPVLSGHRCLVELIPNHIALPVWLEEMQFLLRGIPTVIDLEYGN